MQQNCFGRFAVGVLFGYLAAFCLIVWFCVHKCVWGEVWVYLCANCLFWFFEEKKSVCDVDGWTEKRWYLMGIVIEFNCKQKWFLGGHFGIFEKLILVFSFDFGRRLEKKRKSIWLETFGKMVTWEIVRISAILFEMYVQKMSKCVRLFCSEIWIFYVILISQTNSPIRNVAFFLFFFLNFRLR